MPAVGQKRTSRTADARQTVRTHRRKQSIKCLEERVFSQKAVPYMFSEQNGGCQLDTIARISDLSDRRDQFIPVRKEDLFSALIKQGDLADPAERGLF